MLRGSTVGLVVVGLAVLCLRAGPMASAHADDAVSPPPSVALIGFDALGMDLERVQRLETLFLKELERLTQSPVPSRRAISKLKQRLQRCDGGNACLAAIGRALHVDFVVAGNVAELGDAFVLNVKAVASASGEELRRLESEPLRGQPDELIEAIRVAAYRRGAATVEGAVQGEQDLGPVHEAPGRRGRKLRAQAGGLVQVGLGPPATARARIADRQRHRAACRGRSRRGRRRLGLCWFC